MNIYKNARQSISCRGHPILNLKPQIMEINISHSSCLVRKLCIICVLILSILMLDSCENSVSYGDNGEPTITSVEEIYAVSLAFPAQNKVFKKEDAPPTFCWSLHTGYPEDYIIDIDYMNDGSYISRKVDVGITYILTEEDWNFIKSKAPINNGLQLIRWRVRIDYRYNTNESYCTGWSYFWISTE